jgi:PAS domain-containing protein
LLSEAKGEGEKLESSLRAFRQGKPVVDFDILADIPEGHLIGTILAEGYANCISVPLIWRQKMMGVITLYSTMQDSFAGEEISLLDKMANDVAFALHFLQVKKEATQKEAMNTLLLQESQYGAVTLSPDGAVLVIHADSQRFFRKEPEQMLGETWFDFALPEERAGLKREFVRFLEHVQATPEVEGVATIVGGKGAKERILHFSYHYQENPAWEGGNILCLFADVTEQKRLAAALAASQAQHSHVLDSLPDIVAVVSPEGEILEINGAGRGALGMSTIGGDTRNILDLLYRSRSKSKAHLLEFSLRKQEATNFDAEFDNLAGQYRITLAPLAVLPKEKDRVLFVAHDLGRDTGTCAEAGTCSLQMAALVEVAGDVGNEINNQSNGIINYAQMLLDFGHEGSWKDDQIALVERILHQGEKIAVTAQKLFGPLASRGTRESYISPSVGLPEVIHQ